MEGLSENILLLIMRKVAKWFLDFIIPKRINYPKSTVKLFWNEIWIRYEIGIGNGVSPGGEQTLNWRINH